MKLLKTVWSQSKFSLLAVLLLLVAGLFVINARSGGTDLLLTGVGLNVELSERGTSWIREELAPLLGAGEGEEVAYVSTEMASFQNDSNDNAYYLFKNIQTLCRQDSLDYFLLDKAALENLIGQGLFLDLSGFFTEEELKQREESLIWAVEAPEDGAEVDLEARRALAIRVDSLPFFRDNGPEGELYFAVSAQSSRLEGCRVLWNRLLDWQKQET